MDESQSELMISYSSIDSNIVYAIIPPLKAIELYDGDLILTFNNEIGNKTERVALKCVKKGSSISLEPRLYIGDRTEFLKYEIFLIDILGSNFDYYAKLKVIKNE